MACLKNQCPKSIKRSIRIPPAYLKRDLDFYQWKYIKEGQDDAADEEDDEEEGASEVKKRGRYSLAIVKGTGEQAI